MWPFRRNKRGQIVPAGMSFVPPASNYFEIEGEPYTRFDDVYLEFDFPKARVVFRFGGAVVGVTPWAKLPAEAPAAITFSNIKGEVSLMG